MMQLPISSGMCARPLDIAFTVTLRHPLLAGTNCSPRKTLPLLRFVPR